MHQLYPPPNPNPQRYRHHVLRPATTPNTTKYQLALTLRTWLDEARRQLPLLPQHPVADEQELEVTWPEFLQQLKQSIWASEQDVPTDEAVAIAQHPWQLTMPTQD